MKRIFPLVFLFLFQFLWVPVLLAAPPGSAQIVNSSRIDEDFGHRDAGQIPLPKSPWIESEKAFYRNVLKEYAYDVLVIPFQVQRYAVDAVERSLMTRHLAYRLGLAKDLKIPDPALVAKALGETSRRFDENEVYRLANELRVKILIKGYVGHDREEKMRLTVIVQKSGPDGTFKPNENTRKIGWFDLPFGDTQLPSDVFYDYLEDIIKKSGLEAPPPPAPREQKAVIPLPVPPTIKEVISANPPLSPLMSAYYLQFLGMLYPKQTPAMEYLFERSLVALTRVSPKSPDYPLLKARALFYLHRRPAALAVLETPSTSEAKAFLALLNGNLPELQKRTAEIASPLLKLLAQIELNDLNWSYNREAPEGFPKALAGKWPEWEMLIINRLRSKDEWYRQSNLIVKEKLDEAFPVPGFTARGLALSKLTMGDTALEGDEIQFSVYNHYHKLLSSKIFHAYGPWYPVEKDYLDLLSAIGEYNLLKNAHILTFIKALPDSALQAIGKIEPVYQGHAGLTNLKAQALQRLARDKADPLKHKLTEQSKDLAMNAYLWSQGQTAMADDCFDILQLDSANHLPPLFYYYDADYPRRGYWSHMGEGDRKVLKNSYALKMTDFALSEDQKKFLKLIKNFELALLYSHDDFSNFISLKNFTVGQNIGPNQVVKLSDLVEAHLHRFVGNQYYHSFMADYRKGTKGDLDPIRQMEEEIASRPRAWEPYQELAEFYTKQGNFKKAAETFQRHPLIKEKPDENLVVMSNHALEAAAILWRAGAINESIPFFQISADSDTGSGAEMMSSKMLALMEGDYPKAAWHALQLIQRYNDKQGLRDYMALLHLLGYHKEAWALFNHQEVRSINYAIWQGAFIGHRSEGKSAEEIQKWLLTDPIPRSDFSAAGKFILRAFMMDRALDPQLANFIRNIKWLNVGMGPQFLQVEKAKFADFAEGYHAARSKNYGQAYDLYKKVLHFNGDSDLYDCSLPYAFISAAKLGKIPDLEKDLKRYPRGSDLFAAHLSRGCVQALQGNHSEAVSRLKSASYRIPPTFSLPFPSRYQLVEICEFLHAETGKQEYLKLGLEWAKLQQRADPIYAWPYAVEAKYAESSADRIRALGLALYMDRHSAHIAHFSKDERDKALKWLEHNNPFLLSLKEKRNKAL